MELQETKRETRDLADLQRAFLIRRRRQVAVTVPMIGVVLAGAFTVDAATGTILGIPEPAALAGVAMAFAGLVIFSFVNWRCPSCDGHLGRYFFRTRCGRCGLSVD